MTRPSWKKALLRFALIFAVLGPAGAMAPYWVASLLTLQATAAIPRRTIDGNSGDWHAGIPYIGNTATLAVSADGKETEWVWRDKIHDARDDFEPGESRSNWDIKTVRIIADTTYIYFYVDVHSMANGYQNAFQFNIAMDTQIATGGGTTGFNWFGDDAGTFLTNPSQHSEVNITLDNDGAYIFYDQSYAQPWKQLTWADGNRVWIDWTGGFMEASLKWSDLGFTSVPPRLRLTMGTARRPWAGGSPNTSDKTEDLYQSDFLDVVTSGLYNTSSSWVDDLGDSSVSYSVDIAFDAFGNCRNDSLPLAPQNLRAWDGVQNRWVYSGDTVITNNPIFTWDRVSADGDQYDGIAGYYIQISTSPTVNADGFFHSTWETVVARNKYGAGANNMVVYHNVQGDTWWWGSMDSTTGVPNTDGSDTPIFLMGETYYIRIWARDRRGMLGAASAIFTMPVDYPAWHDPYTFGFDGGTYRNTREPKEGDDVTFTLGVYDPAPMDPKDSYFTHPWANDHPIAPNEILNVILHIRVNRVGHATYDWATQAGKVVMGNQWLDANGNIAWYLPNVGHPSYGFINDPEDTITLWKTGGNPEAAKTWFYDHTSVNLGNSGGATVMKLQSVPGDIIEYFFEINNRFEAPAAYHRQSRAPRRFVYARDANGITGYRLGEWSQAVGSPFRFIVQKRDLTAVWHNPLSNEVPLGPDSSIPLAMRTPAWPETAPQKVKMYVGCVGWGGMALQMVWRNVDSGTWYATNFNGSSVLTDTPKFLYYYKHEFQYDGGMIEYYFKTTDNSLYIFANGITNSSDTVYENSIGPEGYETVPFRFPFTSRVKFTSTGATTRDSHSIVAVLGFKAPRFDAMNKNAIGVNGVLDMRNCSTTIDGNAFANAFPGSQIVANDTIGVSEPHRLIARSYFALLTNLTSTISGVRKAFFGPIYPLDYAAIDSSTWNTGSDAYENVPILTYDEVFSTATERTIPGDHTFNTAVDMKGVVYVTGNATINSVNLVDKSSIIAGGTITIPAASVITAERLDLCALGGTLRVGGSLVIDTGILFSNQSITVETGATVRIRKLGTVVSQTMSFDTTSQVEIVHPPTLSFAAAKESVLSRATRWVISSLRESRR